MRGIKGWYEAKRAKSLEELRRNAMEAEEEAEAEEVILGRCLRAVIGQTPTYQPTHHPTDPHQL
eukprot:3848179-Prorocentrum_lima.AAC.1